MPEFQVQDLFIQEYRQPAITAYNRLEVSPRTRDFHRSISAEVRDPLWMLTRQWQFGEFKGEDAGSPINATLMATTSKMDRIKAGSNPSQALDERMPLETTVEQEQPPQSLLVGSQGGRYMVNLLKSQGLDSYITRFVELYALTVKTSAQTAEIQFHGLIKDQIPDGRKIIQALTDGSYAAHFNGDAQETIILDLGSSYLAWWQRLYAQPSSPGIAPAWQPQQLEYQFSIADGHGDQFSELVADQFYQGHLDWYSFDLKEGGSTLEVEGLLNSAKESRVSSFIPAQVSFKGMPHPRFWQFEEQTIDFGKIDTSPTGLLHLLFAEFGLIYSNDWFILPFPMQVNSLAEIPGIRVTDVFGHHTYIRPTGKDQNSSWQRWAMFQLNENTIGDTETNNWLYLPPSLYKSLQNEPTEQVNFVRDEMSNMVWAVEERIPSEFYQGKPGKETALEQAIEPEATTDGASDQVKYTLGTIPPSNHTPFVPVHIPGSVSQIRLQRARMVDGKSPQGVLLTEKEAPYFINEEEIVKSGISVTRSLQRTRWLNGSTFLWTGRRKQNGQESLWNGLQFDQIDE